MIKQRDQTKRKRTDSAYTSLISSPKRYCRSSAKAIIAEQPDESDKSLRFVVCDVTHVTVKRAAERVAFKEVDALLQLVRLELALGDKQLLQADKAIGRTQIELTDAINEARYLLMDNMAPFGFRPGE